MKTIDEITVLAGIDRVYAAASAVERWPVILSHYRWVRVLERPPGHAVVEMAAWRRFGPIGYPTWWVSEMRLRPEHHEIHYRHIRGITTGMDVVWKLEPAARGVRVAIVHQWRGPRWPLIGPPAATLVIGPIFIHTIASLTLAGIKRFVEHDDG